MIRCNRCEQLVPVGFADTDFLGRTLCWTCSDLIELERYLESRMGLQPRDGA